MVFHNCVICGADGHHTTVFGFPVKEDVRRQWLEVCGMEQATPRMGVCTAHFRYEDFTQLAPSKRLRIKRTAVPTTQKFPVTELFQEPDPNFRRVDLQKAPRWRPEQVVEMGVSESLFLRIKEIQLRTEAETMQQAMWIMSDRFLEKSGAPSGDRQPTLSFRGLTGPGAPTDPWEQLKVFSSENDMSLTEALGCIMKSAMGRLGSAGAADSAVPRAGRTAVVAARPRPAAVPVRQATTSGAGQGSRTITIITQQQPTAERENCDSDAACHSDLEETADDSELAPPAGSPGALSPPAGSPGALSPPAGSPEAPSAPAGIPGLRAAGISAPAGSPAAFPRPPFPDESDESADEGEADSDREWAGAPAERDGSPGSPGSSGAEDAQPPPVEVVMVEPLKPEEPEEPRHAVPFITSSTLMVMRSRDRKSLKMAESFRRFMDAQKKSNVEQSIPGLLDGDFRLRFGICRSDADDLLVELEEAGGRNTYAGGAVPMAPFKRLLILLWVLANQEPMREVARRFAVSPASVVRTVHRQTALICGPLKRKFVAWPSVEETAALAPDGCPRLAGSLGSLAVLTAGGSEARDKYEARGRSGRPQPHVLLQAVCRADLSFADVHVRSVTDETNAEVFAGSPLAAALPERCRRSGQFVVADGSFPLTPEVVTPFRRAGDGDRLSQRERRFNAALGRHRAQLRRAFARLTGRFSRLRFLRTASAQDAVRLIESAAVLHNVCVECGDDGEDLEEHEALVPPPRPPGHSGVRGEPEPAAERARQDVVDLLSPTRQSWS